MIARVRVLESWDETPTTHVVRFEKPPGFGFLPVQFCGLEMPGVDEYPMSLACSPTRPHLEFGARVSGSPWKQAFRALRPGDEAEVDGPYGRFVLDPSRDALLVAGGIGITPLKGMAEYAADARLPREVRLVYASRDADEIVYRRDLEALEAANPRFRVVHTLAREPEGSSWRGSRGRIGPDLLREAMAGLDRPRAYVCGAPGMVAAAATALLAVGVDGRDVLSEKFSGYS